MTSITRPKRAVCEAWCPAGTYTSLRPCSKRANLRHHHVKDRRVLLCPHHWTMVEAGRRLQGPGANRTPKTPPSRTSNRLDGS